MRQGRDPLENKFKHAQLCPQLPGSGTGPVSQKEGRSSLAGRMARADLQMAQDLSPARPGISEPPSFGLTGDDS